MADPRDPGVQWSDEELAAEYGPGDHEELVAASRAVALHRDDAAALDQLDALSAFERELADAAFIAGRQYACWSACAPRSAAPPKRCAPTCSGSSWSPSRSVVVGWTSALATQ